MTMFPPAWDAAISMDVLPDACPYSAAEMEEYLFGNHYHLMREEEPTTFMVSGPCAQRSDAERRYWLFDARDQHRQRQWYLVIGTGRSFSDPRQKLKRWMYAQTNDDDLSPDRFLDEVYKEQLEADARS
jgi:hypothetical protein